MTAPGFLTDARLLGFLFAFGKPLRRPSMTAEAVKNLLGGVTFVRMSPLVSALS